MAYTRVIGLLGGSFNPAHEGHLFISLKAMRHLGLDEIWWLVSPQNPLKSNKDMADFETRYQSALGWARHNRIHVSDLEQKLGNAYTAKTIRWLRRHKPQYAFVWLMGADNLRQIHRWRDWQTIFNEVPVAIYTRAPYTHGSLRGVAATRFHQARVEPRELKAKSLSGDLPAWGFINSRRHPLSATYLRKTLGRKAYLRHNKNAGNADRR